MSRFREYSLDQLLLLSPSLPEWLPKKHVARFIVDITAEWYLQEIYAA